MSDEELELLSRARAGDSDAMDTLMNNYKSLASTIARKYYLIGGDNEELVQEGMIGLYKAIVSFNSDKGVTFKTYASRVIENKIIDAIRHASSGSNLIFNDSVYVDDGDALSSSDPTPESTYLSSENEYELMKEIWQKLDEFERQVMKYYVVGFPYAEIAEKLGKSTKSIDNAISRIKKKLKYLKERL